LIHGRLTAEDYEDDIAKDPRIDELRAKMHCVEDPQITLDYHDPSKRTIGNGLTVTLNDDTKLDEVFIDIPVGHKFRRDEVPRPLQPTTDIQGKPLLLAKFVRHIGPHFSQQEQDAIMKASENLAQMEKMDVDSYVDLYVKS
jgi:2-methylcitrate dehydratase